MRVEQVRVGVAQHVAAHQRLLDANGGKHPFDAAGNAVVILVYRVMDAGERLPKLLCQ